MSHEGRDPHATASARPNAAFDHDIRNALNGLLVSVEALRALLTPGSVTPEAATRFVDAVAEQCQQLAAIVARAMATMSEPAGDPGPVIGASIPARAKAPDGPPPRESAVERGALAPRRVTGASTPEMREGYIANLPKSPRMTHPRILIADDEPAIAAGLGAILADLQYEVEVVADGQQALERLIGERFGLVLADLRMPRVDGLALLKELQQREIPTECIIITGQASIGSAVEAMQSGAYDYIEKPLTAEKLSRLKALIPKALDKYAVRERNRALSSQLEGLTHYAALTGASESMREVYRVIDAVAPSTASVLILGESGTGKELVAHALHTKSERGKGPFFALNCAALPKEILENELFGHEKGAFTGSTNEKPGAFEMASGGTLFLDEVAEMPPDIQVKLLRAIESRMVRRLGGKKEIPVDIRIVAATNKDLQQALEDGELREDLYYRLAVVELYLPPLRERAGDIQLLANEFLARYAQQNSKQITGFDDAAMEWILTYSWPGNVRDLKNAVERAVVLARGPVISTSALMPRHLRIAAAAETSNSVTLPMGSSLSDARRQLALRTFASTGGDLTRAAKILGISATELRAELRSQLEGNSSSADEGVGSEGGAASGQSGAPIAGMASVPLGGNPIGAIGLPPLAGAGVGAGLEAESRVDRLGETKGGTKKVAAKRVR